jgi:hypothetical protein
LVAAVIVKGGSVEHVFPFGGVVPPPLVALLPHAPNTTVIATPPIRTHFVIFIVVTLLSLVAISFHQRRPSAARGTPIYRPFPLGLEADVACDGFLDSRRERLVSPA